MKTVVHKGNIQKVNLTAPSRLKGPRGQMGKLSTLGSVTARPMVDEFTNLKSAALAVQQIRLSAQRELGLAKKMRVQAQRYQQETGTRARSEAQQLILRTRLKTQKEVEELVRQASEEIQQILADIRMIRIAAQEELAEQKKFTDAARLCFMALSFKEGNEATETKKPKAKEPERKRKKQLAGKK